MFDFWKWCREKHHFYGVCNMSNYGEPTLAIDQIRDLMRRIREVDPRQPFQLVTNREDHPEFEAEFDIVKRSRYRALIRLCLDGKPEMDNRTLATTGEGRPYSEAWPQGHCLRGLGWELIVDFYGNVAMCCADFSNECSSGSICIDNWDEIYDRWKARSRTIRWSNEAEYNALPRLCRACLDVNPSLHFREDVDLIRRLPPQRHKDFGVDLL